MAVLPVPTPRTWTTGEVGTGAYENSLRDALNFLIALPIATVFQSAAQALTSGTPAAVNYDSTAVDSYGGHSNSVNPSRYTAVVAGWYLVCGAVPMAGSGAGTYRKVQIYLNGTAIAYATAASPPINSGTAATAVAISPTIVFLNVGDYVQLFASCDTTGVSTTPNTSNEAYMTTVWVHN